MASIFESFQQGRQQGFERGQQNRLQGLMQQAWNAPPEQQQSQLAQIAGINPQAAMGLEKRAMDRREQMQTDAVNLARAWKSSASATPEQRQAFFESFIRPQAQRRGLPLPQTYDPAAFDREADGLIAMGQGGAVPTDVRSFQMMTQGLSPEDQMRARRINLGLEGRASSAGFSQVKFTDAQGRERIGVLNGKTGQIDLPDGTSFNPQTGVIAPTQGGGLPTQASMEADIGLANELIAAGIPEAQVDAFLASRGQRAQQASPAAMAGGVDPFAGRRKEDEAAAVKTAEEQAKAEVEAANARRKAEQEAEAVRLKKEAEAAAERESKQAENARALAVYEQGISGLARGLGMTSTGWLQGKIPALTAGQQIADGGVAAMAPLLKQLFRTAGEGTFTDKDQDLLLAMIPTRDDLPEARAWKLQNIDRIIREKLGAGPAQGQQTPQSTQGRRARNPKTGEILVLRNGQWVPENGR